MNSIDALYKEKKRMHDLASAKRVEVFKMPDKNINSYYIKYKEAKHLIAPFLCYDSAELNVFRNCITDLFEYSCFKEIIPVILAVYMHTKEKNDNQLTKIDLNNYMM